MTFKQLALLGAAIGGATYLSDKRRRDRLMDSANGFLDSARRLLAEVRERAEQSAPERTMRAETHRDLGADPMQPH